MDYNDLIANLDSALDSFGNEPDERLESMNQEAFMYSIKQSELNLNDEYFKIDQIKAESLKDAMNERVVYI